jgi:hypothetical protein
MRCYSNILNQIKKSAWLVISTKNETFKIIQLMFFLNYSFSSVYANKTIAISHIGDIYTFF